jgi:hypothetical protein
LSGILPAAMTWKLRSHHQNFHLAPLLPGGRAALLVTMGIAVVVMGIHIVNHLLNQN